MIRQIVDQLLYPVFASNMSDEIDLIAGLAQPLRINDGGTVKIIPAWIPIGDPCDEAHYVHLHPSDAHRSILYFEHISDYYGKRTSFGQQCRSIVRAVFWYDSRRFEIFTEISVYRRLRQVAEMPPASPIDGITAYKARTEEMVNPYTIFERYTYDEAEQQYLMFPYRAVAFNIVLNYNIAIHCPAGVNELKPQDIC